MRGTEALSIDHLVATQAGFDTSDMVRFWTNMEAREGKLFAIIKAQ
jgi:hypothetical protein